MQFTLSERVMMWRHRIRNKVCRGRTLGIMALAIVLLDGGAALTVDDSWDANYTYSSKAYEHLEEVMDNDSFAELL